MNEEITIIGGGLCGLATALAFKKIGLHSTIYEKDARINNSSTGIILGINALKSLDYLGILGEVQKYATSNYEFRILDNNGKSITTITSDIGGLPIFTIIRRNQLMDILHSTLEQFPIRYKKNLLFITTNNKKSQLYFEDGSIVNSNYLIACDGINSVIRKQLFPQKRLRYAGYTCWQGILHGYQSSDLHSFTETWGPKGRFGTIPLANHSLYWYALKNAQPDDSSLTAWKSKELLKNFKSYHHPIPEIIEQTLDYNISRKDIYDLEPLYQFVYDHILLIGDAAHPATPNLGQGACLAIEDAAYLTECIKNYSNLESAINSFERNRIKRTNKVIQESWKFGKLAQLDNPIFCRIRNQLFHRIPTTFHQNRLTSIQNSML